MAVAAQREPAVPTDHHVHAEERKTGARGLRTTIEEILLDVMDGIPSLDDVRKSIVDANVINDRTRPLLMTEREQGRSRPPRHRGPESRDGDGR